MQHDPLANNDVTVRLWKTPAVRMEMILNALDILGLKKLTQDDYKNLMREAQYANCANVLRIPYTAALKLLEHETVTEWAKSDLIYIHLFPERQEALLAFTEEGNNKILHPNPEKYTAKIEQGRKEHERLLQKGCE